MKEQKQGALLVCEDVGVRYGSHLALQGVSLEIKEGDYLCIVGENGSGKSTLMKAILGLIPLSQGRVAFCGVSRREVGYLPQQTPAQRDFPASVREVVLSGCLNRRGARPFYSGNERQRAWEKMEQMEVLPLRKKSYRELSGGQQQRVLLARALCATERLILLDEPVTGLDPKACAAFYSVLRQLNQEGVAIIMISHDLAGALDNAKTVLHLATQPLFYGTAEQYRKIQAGNATLGGMANV